MDDVVQQARDLVSAGAWSLVTGDLEVAARRFGDAASLVVDMTDDECRRLRDDRLWSTLPIDNRDDRWFRSIVVVYLAHRVGLIGADDHQRTAEREQAPLL